MKLNAKLFLLFAILLNIGYSYSQRNEQVLENNWKFTRNDTPQAFEVNFDDSRWQSVAVPHDWAIYGPFDGRNDRQNIAIIQDGQTEAFQQSGRTGGLPTIGCGLYRNKFEVKDYRPGKLVYLIFDGVMAESKVWVNGNYVGGWPYGYNSFWFDITQYIKEGENLLAVRAENQPEQSRWYTGAGIYRNVHILVTDQVHIPIWGTYVTTPIVTPHVAKVVLETEINLPDKPLSSVILETEIKNTTGEVVALSKTTLQKYNKNRIEQTFMIPKPELWSPDTPNLYYAESKLYADSALTDNYTTRFGIRKLEIVPGDRMYLNGEHIEFKGVCNHHDLGPLGAAVNVAALRYRLKMLKEMGCNAIRTAHNMPEPELIALCDEMGFMVIAESFDEWKRGKVRNGYARFYDDWVEHDLQNLVKKYRNNPSVVIWCIGNEVPDQGGPLGQALASMMRNTVLKFDHSRPVTIGIDQVAAALRAGTLDVPDLPGLNYRLQFYHDVMNRYDMIIGTETASTVSSRGVYKFPVEVSPSKNYSDGQMSSYDTEYCQWSNLPEDDWVFQDDYDNCMGEFVWTGFDYLGEPTPYYSRWPNHSSLFGIIDLANLPKDRFWLYRSRWNPEVETLHILPHWNWEGREGEITPVFVYTNYPSAELFINGVSQGRVSKDLTVTERNSSSDEARKSLMRQRRYRLMWLNTVYQPGELRVVAYDAQDKVVAEKTLKTAGKPYAIEAITDRAQLEASGKDLAFITVRVVDKNGNLCPTATNKLTVAVKGAGATYRAMANGDPTCLEIFHEPTMSAFGGMLTAIVRSSETEGESQVTISSKGLKPAVIKIVSK
jgi:beta-galactosidase